MTEQVSATKEHIGANDDLVYLGLLVKDTASATHALSCGVPDTDSNETKYLGEALEMIEEWHTGCSRRPLEGQDGHDTMEVILVERPR